MKIIFIGLGTRGDVIPFIYILPKLLSSLLSKNITLERISSDTLTSSLKARITFISNRSNELWLQQELNDLLIPIPMTIHYVDNISSSSTLTREPTAEERTAFYSTSQLTNMLSSILQENDLSNKSCKRLVITNLFALEAVLFAEAWQNSKCVIIHPHFIPSSNNNSYSEANSSSLSYATCPPFLYDWLQSDASVFFKKLKANIRLQKLFHQFLWPLLTETYDSCRLAFGLPLLSEISDDCELPLFDTCIVLISTSPQLFAEEMQNIFTEAKVVGFIRRQDGDFNPSSSTSTTTRLYSSEKTTNFLHNLQASEGEKNQNQNTLQQFIENEKKRFDSDSLNYHGIVCVDFGSMMNMIVESFSLRVFARAIWTLLQRERDTFSFIIICHGSRNYNLLLLAFLEINVDDIINTDINIEHLFVVENDVCHSFLFPKCVSVINHGGSGTIAKCLHVGVPNVIMPIIHDQFANSQKLYKGGFSCPPISIDTLFPECDSLFSMVSSAATTADADADAGAGAGASTAIVKSSSSSNSSSEPSTRSEEEDKIAVAVAVDVLSDRLLQSTSPQHRLKCACRGKTLFRENQNEDGVENNVVEILNILYSL